MNSNAENFETPNKVGILVNHLIPKAYQLGERLIKSFDNKGSWWLEKINNTEEMAKRLYGTELIITIGGDGTILRAAHISASRKIPILGINMGNVGFMCEVESSDVLEKLPHYINGNSIIEERIMLRALIDKDGNKERFDALNDIVLARGAKIRVIEISVKLNGTHLATYRGDGVVLSTPTGSTGYSLSLGGPVVSPWSKGILLKPIGSHMSLHGGVVLDSNSQIDLMIRTENSATLSIDGFIDIPMSDLDSVNVVISDQKVKFIRRSGYAGEFWALITKKLGMRKGNII